ncbi:hypothetical protein [Natronomonas sp. EA1]|uniref:hypothetical protein n=1 Tax=Natronomonas sp. EA1 TaxID=3421655 RepID=UPI003EBBCB66
MTRVHTLALLALCVLLAGCGGFANGSQPTETLSPVPVPADPETPPPTSVTPTPTPDPPGERLALGLTTAGVTDPFVLAGSHRSHLRNSSYTRIETMRIEAGNTTLREWRRVTRVAPSGRPYHVVEVSESHPSYPVSAANAHLEIWFDGGPALFRVGEEQVDYRVGTTGDFGGPLPDVTGHDRLAALYGEFTDWSVLTTTTFDGHLHILTSESSRGTAVLRPPLFLANVSDAEVRIAVRGDGRVQRHSLVYEATFDGEPVRVVRATSFENVGNTTVERPGWYDEARNATTRPAGGSEQPLPE